MKDEDHGGLSGPTTVTPGASFSDQMQLAARLPGAGEDSGKPVFTTYTFLPLKDLAFQYVQAVVAEAGYNKTLAAKMLGVDRRTLYRILTRGRVGNVSKY